MEKWLKAPEIANSWNVKIQLAKTVCLKFKFPGLFFVSVPPLFTEVIGIEGSLSEKTVVTLMCRSSGARPAAVISWFNGSVPFTEMTMDSVALQVRQIDGPYFPRIEK